MYITDSMMSQANCITHPFTNGIIFLQKGSCIQTVEGKLFVNSVVYYDDYSSKDAAIIFILFENKVILSAIFITSYLEYLPLVFSCIPLNTSVHGHFSIIDLSDNLKNVLFAPRCFHRPYL